MARFNTPTRNPLGTLPDGVTEDFTHEGGLGYVPNDPAVQLLFAAACTLAGEDTYYETAAQRIQRLVDLTHSATKRDSAEVEKIANDLRNLFYIRTASVIVACEYVKAGGPNGRKVVDSICQRADEPGEVLAYWLATHGRKIPRGIKMGLGDAARRLYTEFNILKYDTASKGVRFGDVLELCHVKPDNESQATLFKFLLDQRHHNDGNVESFEILYNHKLLTDEPEDQRRRVLRENGPQTLAKCGFTWERLSSWLPGGMDAEAWESVIPSMGVMALIRNLRNFDDASISSQARDLVIAKITNQENVIRSKIFPYQVLLSYQFAKSDNWKMALNTTLDLASGNLPRLDGSVLCIDTSGSMTAPLSKKSQASCVTVAALQAASVARHSRDCKVVLYADSNYDVTNEVRGRSVLGAAEWVYQQVGKVGYGTNGHSAVRDHFDADKHTRAILFTDDQQRDSGRVSLNHVPQIVTFNIGGYAPRSTYGKGRVQVTGFSDAIFDAIAKILNIQATAPTGTTV